MDTITLLRPDGLVSTPAFSHVAVIPPGATTIHVGGQNGVDETGAVVAGDLAGQTARAIDNLRTALEAAGATLGDVVSWLVLVVDGEDFAAGAAVAMRALDPDRDPPLITAAKVTALGVPGALVEISAVAAVVR